MKRYSTLFFLLFISFQNFGQGFLKNITKERSERIANQEIWKAKSFGGSFNTFQNTVFSPLNYFGLGYSYNKIKFKTYKNQMRLSQNDLNLNYLFGSYADVTFVGLNYQFSKARLYKISDKFYAGGELSFLSNFRVGSKFQNNAIQFESSLNLAPRILYRTRILNMIDSEFHFSLPIAGFSMFTPRYAYSFDAIGVRFNWLKNTLKPQTGIFFNFNPSKKYPNKQFRVGYQWQMLYLNRSNNIRFVNGINNFYIVGNLTKIK